MFTQTLVASLSPTLDAILKDLFMSTVIPKFEQACCSMFKQIDASFTERSLECEYLLNILYVFSIIYDKMHLIFVILDQNELKLLLNEEGNINYKLEYAFDKFKSDMSNVIKNTEKNILRYNSQNKYNITI